MRVYSSIKWYWALWGVELVLCSSQILGFLASGNTALTSRLVLAEVFCAAGCLLNNYRYCFDFFFGGGGVQGLGDAEKLGSRV